MAGVKGRSGGARPGAGRPPKARDDSAPKTIKATTKAAASKSVSADIDVVEAENMLDLLQKVALGQIESTPLQVRAAIAAVQYTHIKAGEGGKKDAQKDAAKKAGAGRFASAVPPKLVASGGKKI